MTKYVMAIVVDVDDSYWSEHNDRDLSCMRAVYKLFDEVNGADEVPYMFIRKAEPEEKNH